MAIVRLVYRLACISRRPIMPLNNAGAATSIPILGAKSTFDPHCGCPQCELRRYPQFNYTYP